MARRPIWKGQLRLSLVAIPIEVFAATESGSQIKFRQIHQPSGKPVRYEKVVAGVGPVDEDDILKGFEISKNDFILIDPDEIADIRIETKKTFEIVQFVDSGEIAPLYYENPYYVVPADDLAKDAYRVVRDALRKAGKVGLGQITMYGREHLAAVRPGGDGLLMETLRYADEIRDADPLFSDINDAKVDAELLEVALALIDRKTAPFRADAFKDHYTLALRAMIEAKRANKKTPRVTTEDSAAPSTDNVIDLMAALKQSLAKAGANAASPTPSKARAKAKSRAKAS